LHPFALFEIFSQVLFLKKTPVESEQVHPVLQVTGHSRAVFPLAHLFTLCLSLLIADLFLPPEAQEQFFILIFQLDCHLRSLSWHGPSTVGVATGFDVVAVVGVATGFDEVGTATGFDVVGVATGFEVVGTDTGFDVVGVATGFDVVGTATGVDVVGTATGFELVGVATGIDVVGPETGFDAFGVATGEVGVATGVAVCPSQVNAFTPSAYTNTRATPGEELVSIEHTSTMRFPADPQE